MCGGGAALSPSFPASERLFRGRKEENGRKGPIERRPDALGGRIGRARLAQMRRAVPLAMVTVAACLSSCARHQPAATPNPGRSRILETRVGLASFYGREFHGRTTASGVRFDMNALVAA